MQTAHFRSVNSALGHPNVDAEGGVIRDVVLMAEGPIKWDRGFADHKTLQTVLSCVQTFGVEGLPIVFNPDTFDHGPAGIAGSYRYARIDGTEIKGDLHVLKFFSARDYLIELAGTQPATFGLSVDFWPGPDEKIGDKVFWRCAEIMKATVVITPAATRGMFKAGENRRPVDAAPQKSQAKFRIYSGQKLQPKTLLYGPRSR